jgi:ribonuclease BN (tRNA processing enzyme)
MKVIFLGTNGWYDTQTGNSVCTLIDSAEGYFIFDAGDGIYKINKYIEKKKPIYLFLSHLHLDHISGFHILPTLMKNKVLTIILEKGHKKLLNNIVCHPYMVPLGNNFKFLEIKEGKYNTPVKFECRRIKHIDPTMGYRLTLENKIISYCLDTGISENVYKLADLADLLITECSMLPGKSNQEWGHLNPKEAGLVAASAKVKKMIMTHISVQLKSLAERKKLENVAKEYFKNSTIANDELIIELK